MKSCGRLPLIWTAFPEILKTSAKFAAAQGDDGVCALYGPMHARALEPGADHHFTAGLHHAGRGAEALFVELWIAHAVSIVPDVADTSPCLEPGADHHFTAGLNHA